MQRERIEVVFEPGSEGMPFIWIRTQVGSRGYSFDPQVMGVDLTARAVASVLYHLVYQQCGRQAPAL